MRLPKWTGARPTRAAVVRYLVVVAAIGALTAVLTPLRSELSDVNVVLLYLLLVVLIAARWGWGPARFASVAANLAFNFFFQEPLYRLDVHDLGNAIELLIFLGVAALTSALLSRARAGEAAARRREEETTILYELSRLIIGDIDLPSTLAHICDRVRDTFSAGSCTVLLRGENGLAPAAWSGPPADERTATDEGRAAEQAMRRGEIVALDAPPGGRPAPAEMTGHRPASVMYAPLGVHGRVIGVLRVTGPREAQTFTVDERRLLEAFADQAALATDRARLVQEAALGQALQETNRLKSALLAAVSHDLRTPLASIKAAVSSLLQPDMRWDPATRHEFLSAIDEETDRLTHLVSNLLDLSRIEGGALRPDLEWYEVRELLETVVARLERTVRHHRLVLDVDPETGTAPLDYVQIGQVVTNLVENAAKYAPEDTDICVCARRNEGAVEISVADQGPGIPAAEREQVFEKFHRVEGAGGRTSGTGLGLAISKGLVEAHGGRIHMEDAPGGGARFVFSIPAPAPPASPLALTAESR